MKVLNAKSLLFIVIAVLCAVILLFIGKGGSKESTVTEETGVREHEAEIEQRLTRLISELDSVSDVKVMATVECGIEYVYAENIEETENARRSEYHSTADKEPLIIKEISPKIKGVAVVCKGGDNSMIKNKIIQLVSGVLGLSSNRIFVGS